MHVPLCICSLTEPIKTRTRVVAVSHHKELGRNSNSARLIPMCLEKGHMIIRGRKNERPEASRIAPSGFKNVVLFPSEDARPLDEMTSASDPINLIIPDGNWGQARRMLRREPVLKGLERVKLPPGPPSQFRLRRQKKSDHVSTFEAVARSLGVLDGPRIEAYLERIFQIMVERTLWSRGELAATDVTGGIPEAAFRPNLVNGAPEYKP